MNFWESQRENDELKALETLCQCQIKAGGHTDPGTPKQLSKQQQDNNKPTRGLTAVMAHGITVSQLPLLIVSSVFTMNIIKHLDRTITIPTEGAVTEATIAVSCRMAHTLKQYLKSDANVGSFTADTWSTPGWSTKFIGLTYHYLNSSLQPHSAMIGFACLKGP